eukprot:6318766-Pyramimonas_sp.AAC.1
MQRSRQGLGEDVCMLVLIEVHVKQFDGPLSNPVSNQVVSMCFALESFTSFWAMNPAPILSICLLGDEEVEEGAVVEDTTARERLPVSVVAGPVVSVSMLSKARGRQDFFLST